jgi:hypothetical protein
MINENNKDFYRNLSYDVFKINWNKNPITMQMFLSFLKVPVEFIKDHLGSYTGWTMRINKQYKLVIGGGIVTNKEYLDTLQFGEKLQNNYNNYVNPFYLQEILTDEGVFFFIEYYKQEIMVLIEKQKKAVEVYKNKMDHEIKKYKRYESEFHKLKDFYNKEKL